MSLGAVPYNVVCKAKDGLINFIHTRSSLIRIKHVHPQLRSQETVIWVTLSDECHLLRRELLGEIIATVGFLQTYAAKHWKNVLDDPTVIRLTKMDFCRDYIGSFIPDRANELYQRIKEQLCEVFDVIAADDSLNILPDPNGVGYIIRAGDNRIRTSF